MRRAEGLRLGRLEIGGGFLLLAALLFYFDEQCLLPRALAACALHELGHLAAIRALGGRVERMVLGAAGAEIRLRGSCALSYGGEILAAAAGPAVNLALAWLLGGWFPVFAGMSLALGLFNLLPVYPLDGGRILYHALAALRDEGTAARACRRLTAGLSLVTAAAGTAVLWRSGRNFTLLLVGGWLLLGALRGRKRLAKRRRNGYNGAS